MKSKIKHLVKANEIAIHYKRSPIDTLPNVGYTDEAVKHLRTIIDEETLDLKEYFWVMLLTAGNHLLGISQIGNGGVIGVDVSIREIIQLALLTNAVQVTLVHNHPSGNLEISHKDIKFTNKFHRLAKEMDVHIRDHIIITSEGYTSMLGKGLIPEN